MRLRRVRSLFYRLPLLVALVLALSLGVVLAGSNSTTLPNGADLTVSINSPVTSTEFVVPPGDATRDVDVSGTASVGLGEPDATFVYVVDVSGSTESGSGTGCSPILGCEKVFVKGLNNAVIANGSADEVGVAVYASSSATADMSPAGGDQIIVAPDDDTYVDTVVDSMYAQDGGNGGVGQYTNKTVGYRTNFAGGLQAALTIVNASTNSINIVVFLSDGVSNEGGADFGSAVSNLANAGAVIHSIAVGSGSSCTGGSDGTLQQMADGTGGTCTEVVDPGNLPSIIPDLVSTSLNSLEIAVDGGAKTAIGNADIDPDLPQPGPVSVSYATTVSGLAPGDHTICVTANGSDTAGSGSVEQCETIHLLQLTLEPATETNELGLDNVHTVLATILGDPSQVAGRLVNFTVSGQNAGATGTCSPNADCTTDASGQVSFEYSVPLEPDSLGTDTIQACTTIAGDETCVEVTKEWVDTTPPEVACTETVNPHGNKIPPAGSTTPPGSKGGQNEDGFYQLTAQDDVDPNPMIYVTDSGSGMVFGPFPSGTQIKYTEDSEAVPEQKKMGSDKGQAGAIDWHIIGNGDPCVYAVDVSGNQSECVDCLVPPPPK